MKTRSLYALALLAFPVLATAADNEWRFRVFLDDKEIGYHAFRLSGLQGHRFVDVEASFEYKLLFLELFRYTHMNSEVWTGDCLEKIDARTNSNGAATRLSGRREGDRFIVRTESGHRALPACVMTFAYWNPHLLEQDRLLDPQSGELLDIEISKPEQVELEIGGALQSALRYRLDGADLAIELWYSDDQEWLALEADAAGGRKLRYERIEHLEE